MTTIEKATSKGWTEDIEEFISPEYYLKVIDQMGNDEDNSEEGWYDDWFNELRLCREVTIKIEEYFTTF